MNSSNSLPHIAEPEHKWVYTFAGVLAVGIAAVVQFAFNTLALALPLGVIGLGLILRNVLVHKRRVALAEAELESGEPLAEEIAEPAKPAPREVKISAKDGGFAKSVTAKSKGDGHIDLSSTKYLNRRPGEFRKGHIESTNDE